MTEEKSGAPTSPEEPQQSGQASESPATSAAADAAPSPAPASATEPSLPTPPPPPTPPVSAATPQQPTSPYAESPQPTMPLPQSPYGAAAPKQQVPYGSAPQPGAGAPYAPVGYQPQPAPGTPGNGKAMGALICGICAIVLSSSVILGIILGIIAIVLAGQYVKSFGKDGKATGGKVCGIIGIVFSVLALAFYVFFGAVAAMLYSDYGNTYSSTTLDSLESVQPDEPNAAAPSDSEQDAVDALVAVTTALELSDNQQVVAYVAEQADEAFFASADQTLADVGIDSTEFALWLMEGMQADIDASDVYVQSDGTGEAFAAITCRNMTEVLNLVYDDMMAFSESGGTFASDDEYITKLSELMKAAMEASPTTESYISLELEKKGDTWKVDEGSLEDAAEQMFALY